MWHSACLGSTSKPMICMTETISKVNKQVYILLFTDLEQTALWWTLRNFDRLCCSNWAVILLQNLKHIEPFDNSTLSLSSSPLDAYYIRVLISRSCYILLNFCVYSWEVKRFVLSITFAQNAPMSSGSVKRNCTNGFRSSATRCEAMPLKSWPTLGSLDLEDCCINQPTSSMSSNAHPSRVNIPRSHAWQPSLKPPRALANLINSPNSRKKVTSIPPSDLVDAAMNITGRSRTPPDPPLRENKNHKTSPWSCSRCKTTYSTKEELMVHLNSHKNAKYTCIQCGAAYKSTRALGEHNAVCWRLLNCFPISAVF